jgi:hypothetical protein
MPNARKEIHMTGYLTHDAHLARLDDLRLRADARRSVKPSSTPNATAQAEAVSIRRATESDHSLLERLAALDSSTVPSGDVLIAEVGDEPRAALEIATGAAVADPFHPTAHLVELLALRAARLRDGRVPRRRLRLRSAYRTA